VFVEITPEQKAELALLQEKHNVDGVLISAHIRRAHSFAVIDGKLYTHVATGFIVGDRKDRFLDGQWIRTSYLRSRTPKDGVIRTLNSTYLIQRKN
jgi:hypothetical protein